MRPLKLTIRNFGPYAGEEIIDFSPLEPGTIFLVTGPTGAGKTTIFDALCYALYGSASGEARQNENLRCDLAAPEAACSVELDFEARGKFFHILRRPAQRLVGARGALINAAASVELELPDKGVLTKINEANEAIEGVLGLTEEQFKKIVLLAQGEFRRLLQASSDDKQKIFRQLFDTATLERLTQTLKARDSEMQKRTAELKLMIKTELAGVVCGELEELDAQKRAAEPDVPRLLKLLSTEISGERKKAEKWKKEREKLKAERSPIRIEEAEANNRRHAEHGALRLHLEKLCLEHGKNSAALARRGEILELLAERADIAEKAALLEARRGELLRLGEKFVQMESAAAAANRKRSEYLAAYEGFLGDQAGALAAMLKPGESCPVCGSFEHPMPAKRAGSAITEAQVARLKTESERAAESLRDAEILCRTAYNALSAGAETPLPSFEELLQGRDALGAALEHLSGQLNELRGKIAVLTQRAEAVTPADYSEKRLFEREFLLQKKEKTALDEKEERERFAAESAGASAGLEALEKEIAGRPEQDISALRLRIAELEAAEKHAEDEAVLAAASIRQNEARAAAIQKYAAQLAGLDGEAADVHELARLARGDNGLALTFEAYALTAYFEDIIALANLRLERMTAGRFAFRRRENKEKRGRNSGLDLDIFDSFTACLRPVSTLSGGQSFMASLSLALGLADMIGMFSGAVQIETLFIDEGFGSLDSDALDSAIAALSSLEQAGRTVGIISHVPELAERIRTKLVVTSEHGRSHAAFHF